MKNHTKVSSTLNNQFMTIHHNSISKYSYPCN